MKRNRTRLLSWGAAVLLIAANLAGGHMPAARAASTAGFTSIDAAVDGGNNCLNGKLSGVTVVNCNIYTGKQYVWLNGGPVAAALGDGTYFFAVLTPGGQPDPNDGAPKNLSDTTAAPWPAGSLNADGSAIPSGDSYTNRTFTVSGGVISYSGTHTFDSANQLIRLMPYDDTTNPGGVYIMAVCSLGPVGGPLATSVTPSDCKYDAFKVKAGTPVQVTAMFSGEKYLDANGDGVLDNSESGLPNWTISITCVGCGHGGKDVVTTTTTDASGQWSFSTSFAPTKGTTTYIIKEVLQAGWVETGNTTNVSMAAGGATSSLSSFVYTVTIPNYAVSTVDMLDFGNINDATPPSCVLKSQTSTQIVVAIQDSDGGLAATTGGTYTSAPGPTGGIQLTSVINASVVIPAVTSGTTGEIDVVATKINTGVSSQVTLQVTDVAGNVTTCDPVQTGANRADGKPTVQAVNGIEQTDHLAHIYNGSPGVANLTITVNGRDFSLHGLGDGQTATIDIASALKSGSNSVSVTTTGKPGGSASLLFGNI